VTVSHPRPTGLDVTLHFNSPFELEDRVLRLGYSAWVVGELFDGWDAFVKGTRTEPTMVHLPTMANTCWTRPSAKPRLKFLFVCKQDNGLLLYGDGHQELDLSNPAPSTSIMSGPAPLPLSEVLGLQSPDPVPSEAELVAAMEAGGNIVVQNDSNGVAYLAAGDSTTSGAVSDSAPADGIFFHDTESGKVYVAIDGKRLPVTDFKFAGTTDPIGGASDGTLMWKVDPTPIGPGERFTSDSDVLSRAALETVMIDGRYSNRECAYEFGKKHAQTYFGDDFTIKLIDATAKQLLDPVQWHCTMIFVAVPHRFGPPDPSTGPPF